MRPSTEGNAPLLARWFGYIYSKWDAERRAPVTMVRWRGREYIIRERT